MYNAVWTALDQGQCIGIFPEGGSHDRTDLLPLKAGACIMALGAMVKYGKPVSIVTAGLNYFKGHRFRSKVVVEFNKCYTIPMELAELYKTNKRDAIANLLKDIEEKLRDVVVSVPSFKELSAVYLARQLYVTDGTVLSREQESLLNRRLATGYKAFRDHPEITLLFTQIREYNTMLRNLGVNDKRVKSLSTSFLENFITMAYSLLVAIVSSSFALPGLIFTGPIALILRYLSEKERRKALAKSDVKIYGRDVIASHKIITALSILPIVFTIFYAAFYYIFREFSRKHRLLFTIFFSILWPLYLYLMIISSGIALTNFRIVKSRVFLLIYPDYISRLRERRAELHKKIQKFVDEHGAEVVKNFEETRVVPKPVAISKRESQRFDEVFQTLEEMKI
eukprot:TRINITY_DN1191_c0_g4_i3.p1 TRINITY_DN1191_c0_g4~~TRINITY_DN1191_c0_g4_i3.p1  ORF type:complete len:395 (+),score=74.35 TRINITY_DN1191_c0_g4_i3:405-1589(+)